MTIWCTWLDIWTSRRAFMPRNKRSWHRHWYLNIWFFVFVLQDCHGPLRKQGYALCRWLCWCVIEGRREKGRVGSWVGERKTDRQANSVCACMNAQIFENNRLFTQILMFTFSDICTLAWTRMLKRIQARTSKTERAWIGYLRLFFVPPVPLLVSVNER